MGDPDGDRHRVRARRRCSPRQPRAGAVKVLLLTLAIVDDIGAIAVIAVFYSDDLEPELLLVGLVIASLVAVLHRVGVTSAPLLASWASRCGWRCTSPACTRRSPAW